MPTPIEFKEQTKVYGKDQPQYLPLHAWINPNENSMGEVVSKWQFSNEEWEYMEQNDKSVFSTICTFHGQHSVTLDQLKKAIDTIDHETGIGVISLVGLPPSRIDVVNPIEYITSNS